MASIYEFFHGLHVNLKHFCAYALIFQNKMVGFIEMTNNNLFLLWIINIMVFTQREDD